MNKLGRKIYYETNTGNVIREISERQGFVLPTTVEQDIITYKNLSERNRDTFDVIELEYGQYAQDFRESEGYRVNPETKELEFSYPDPNAEEEEQPYQTPLSERIEELEATYMYDSMMKDMAIEESNNQQAEMMYQLMMNGVL